MTDEFSVDVLQKALEQRVALQTQTYCVSSNLAEVLAQENYNYDFVVASLGYGISLMNERLEGTNSLPTAYEARDVLVRLKEAIEKGSQNVRLYQ